MGEIALFLSLAFMIFTNRWFTAEQMQALRRHLDERLDRFEAVPAPQPSPTKNEDTTVK